MTQTTRTRMILYVESAVDILAGSPYGIDINRFDQWLETIHHELQVHQTEVSRRHRG